MMKRKRSESDGGSDQYSTSSEQKPKKAKNAVSFFFYSDFDWIFFCKIG